MHGFWDDLKSWGEDVVNWGESAAEYSSEKVTQARKQVSEAYDGYIRASKKRKNILERLNKMPEGDKKDALRAEFEKYDNFFFSTLEPAAKEFFSMLGLNAEEELAQEMGALPAAIPVIMTASAVVSVVLGYIYTYERNLARLDKKLPTLGMVDSFIGSGTQTKLIFAGAAVLIAFLV